MIGRPLYRLRRWLKLEHGRGRAMRDAGASVVACPLCSRDTPVYVTPYTPDGEPLLFSVCVWCGGHIEWPGTAVRPREAYGFSERTARSRNR